MCIPCRPVSVSVSSLSLRLRILCGTKFTVSCARTLQGPKFSVVVDTEGLNSQCPSIGHCEFRPSQCPSVSAENQVDTVRA